MNNYPYPKTWENCAFLHEEARKIQRAKLADYGTADLTQVEQIVQRIKEKNGRIENLIATGSTQVKDENLIDTFLDICNYAIIGACMEKDEWGVDGERLDDKILISREPEAKEFDLPRPKKDGDVGHDLYTVRDEVIPANLEKPIDIKTGVRIKLPHGKWALIINRSSTPRKLGIEVVNGVIDEGYTGELFACVYNRTSYDVRIPRGTRLAQFLIFNSHTPEIREVDVLPTTERGETGFGSTGS